MGNKTFLKGVTTTIIVSVICFWVVGLLTNGDPLWFSRSFHSGVSVVTIYWDDAVYALNPGDPGYEQCAEAFVDGVAHWRGYEGLVVFSENHIRDYRKSGRLLEVQYERPVQVHTRHSYQAAPVYLVPLNRGHSYYRRVFSLPAHTEWSVAAINMDERRFDVLLTAVEQAVTLAAVDRPEQDVKREMAYTTPAAVTKEPVVNTLSTPVPNPLSVERAALENLPFADFLEESYLTLSLRYPEYMTELGVADAVGLGNDKLDNLSDTYVRETHQLENKIYDILLTYDRQSLPPSEQRSYDIYKWYLEDLVASQKFMYDDYLLNQFILSVHNSTLHFFTEIHPLTSYELAEDYLVRLAQIDEKFASVLEGLKIREMKGVILPKFLIQWTVRDLQAMAGSVPGNTPYIKVFKAKVAAIPGMTDEAEKALLSAAEDIVEQEVLPAYQRLADYYRDLLGKATNDAGVWKFPDGASYYAYMLKHFTTTDLRAEEIHQLGLEEVDRLESELRIIFNDLGYPADLSIPELFERVAQDSGYLTGQQILEGYRTLIQDATQRVHESFDLLPSTDVVVIEDEVGGFYVAPARDGSRPGAFYALASGRQPKFAMPTLAYHETVPGHHLQIALAQELDLPSFRQESHFTAYTEGWALYAEQLAWELEFYEDDPYGNLGRLQAEMFRAVRLVVDTGIHWKGWSFDQAVDYMQEHTGQENRMVQYQVARYIVWPGQAVAYKIGMMKMLELRQHAMDALGDAFDIRTFHNVILSEGAVPLPILEEIVNAYIQAESSAR